MKRSVSRWGVFDLETTILNTFKRKADPFNPGNWIVMMGLCTELDLTPRGYRFMQATSRSEARAAFINLLDSTRMIVGHNIKFDILYMMQDRDTREYFRAWVAAGGRIFCTQLAEYLLMGMSESSRMSSLDDLCVKYGLDTKVDEVKVLWEAGVSTEDIDPDLLKRYLLGEDLVDPYTGNITGRREGDIGNTRDVFLAQAPLIRNTGLTNVVLMNMDALLATIEMEFNGMYTDTALGYAIADELSAELTVLQQELQDYVPKDLPVDFNWGNRYHLSPLIFGGAIKYNKRMLYTIHGEMMIDPEEAAEKQHLGLMGIDELVYSLKDEEVYILTDGSTAPVAGYDLQVECNPESDMRTKYLSGKKLGEFKTKKVKVPDYSKPKGKIVQLRYELPGYVEPRDGWESATEGLYSVAADIIQELFETTDIPFLKKLGEVTALSKDLSTYFVTTDKDGNKVGMLTQVRDNNIIHHSINMTTTATARMSATSPNMQNIPKGGKSRAKELFISRYTDGFIIQSDFSALEAYIQTILTKDVMLTEDILKGRDVHCIRLAMKLKEAYDKVHKLCRGYTNDAGDFVEPDPEWEAMRDEIKPFTFQRNYGASAKKISQSTGIPVEVVEAMIEAETLMYVQVEEYFQKRMHDLEANAVPTSSFCAHPDNPAVTVQKRLSRVSVPSGKLYTFVSYPSFGWQLKRGVRDTFKPTEARNYDVQGEGAEVMKLAMGLAVREFYRLNNFGNRACIINTVHDALMIDCAPEKFKDVSVLLQACMEAASDMYKFMYMPDMHLQVPSDTTYGKSMAEENHIREDGFDESVAEVRNELRERYMKGIEFKYDN